MSNMKKNFPSCLTHRRCQLLAAVLGVALGFSQPTHATIITVNLTAAATATDYGPQDGVYDAMQTGPLGYVVNNGYTSWRIAMEFNLSRIPQGATINAATLTLFVNYIEGIRQIALNGYAGVGTISLPDFSQNGLVGNATLEPSGSHSIAFDATTLLQNLCLAGNVFAGFNLREDPANDFNYNVLLFNLDGAAAPQLSIDYTLNATAVPENGSHLIDIALLLPVAIVSLRQMRRCRLASTIPAIS